MAEQLQEQGFLQTPEQCLTKFKNLQSCYFKVRRGHMPEPCIFHEEMDVLSSSWASVATVTRPRGKRYGCWRVESAEQGAHRGWRSYHCGWCCWGGKALQGSWPGS
uniref:Myb/SANT-like DNA-binding domain-containing protein n=1 Tax=Equus caballus TaxID=9796 RepID=A0A9L0RWE8_HORSE